MLNEVNCNEESFLNNNNKKFYSDQNNNNMENNLMSNYIKDSNVISDLTNVKLNHNNDIRKSLIKTKKSNWIKIKKNFYLSLLACLMLYLYYVYMNVKIFLVFYKKYETLK